MSTPYENHSRLPGHHTTRDIVLEAVVELPDVIEHCDTCSQRWLISPRFAYPITMRSESVGARR